MSRPWSFDAQTSNWSDKKAVRQLLALARAIPGAGGGTQSRTISGLGTYTKDMEAFMPVTKYVLAAVACFPPDPTFGDDGHRDDARQTAIDALTWAEGWALWRNENQWSDRCVSYGDVRWDDPTLAPWKERL